MEFSGNYRSTQRVIDYYRNYQSTNINIESFCKYAAVSGTVSFNNDVELDKLDRFIADIIQKNIDAGIPEHEICVLAPQWWLIIPMGRKLKKLLPDTNFDALGLSPLLKNKENFWFKVARLFLVLPSPKMYFIRNRWASELIEEMDTLGVKILEGASNKPKMLLKICNSIKSSHDDGLVYLEECFEQFLEIFSIQIDEHVLLKQHWQYFFDGSKKRLENPDFAYAKDIKSFRRLFNHNVGVVVNTCHGIKGEEFHTVIAFGLLHGYIPNWSEEDPEAARKLLYVICSRSKQNLHLISELGRKTRSGNAYNTTALLQTTAYEYDEE